MKQIKLLLACCVLIVSCADPKEYCDSKLPKNWNLVFNRLTHEYAIKTSEDTFLSKGIKGIYWGTYHEYPYEYTSKDSCEVKMWAIEYLENSRVDNEYLENFIETN